MQAADLKDVLRSNRFKEHGHAEPLIQEEKPKGKGKDEHTEKFDFWKTVKPVLVSFKKQLHDDKDKM